MTALIAGPPARKPIPVPPWLELARRDQAEGLAEVKGPGSNARIMGWARAMGGWIASWYKGDDIPWCALAMNGWLAECGIRGTGSLAAASFETFGFKLGRPVLGAIVTFVRPGGNHVGIYVGERIDGALRILGGNQGDRVREDWFAAERVTSIRWPEGVEIPEHDRIILAGDGRPLSSNEA